MSRRTQKVEIYLANEASGLAFVSTNLGHISRSKVGKQLGLILRKKHLKTWICLRQSPHTLSHNITDLIELNFEDDTKNPLPRCFLIILELKTRGITTTWQYENCQTFNKLQFRPLLKNSSHNTDVDLRDTSGEKLLFVSNAVNQFVVMFRKTSNNIFSPKRRYHMVVSRQVELLIHRRIGRHQGQGLVAIARYLENRNSILV